MTDVTTQLAEACLEFVGRGDIDPMMNGDLKIQCHAYKALAGEPSRSFADAVLKYLGDDTSVDLRKMRRLAKKLSK